MASSRTTPSRLPLNSASFIALLLAATLAESPRHDSTRRRPRLPTAERAGMMDVPAPHVALSWRRGWAWRALTLPRLPKGGWAGAARVRFPVPWQRVRARATGDDARWR